ncbi:hypothetical protein GIB67_033885, partial [Kingdonia uniflora]
MPLHQESHLKLVPLHQESHLKVSLHQESHLKLMPLHQESHLKLVPLYQESHLKSHLKVRLLEIPQTQKMTKLIIINWFPRSSKPMGSPCTQ